MAYKTGAEREKMPHRVSYRQPGKKKYHDLDYSSEEAARHDMHRLCGRGYEVNYLKWDTRKNAWVKKATHSASITVAR